MLQDDVMNIYVAPFSAPNTETLHQANGEVQQENTYQYSVYCPQEKLLQDTDDYVLLDDNFDISHEVAILDDIADDVCMLQSCWMTDNQ